MGQYETHQHGIGKPLTTGGAPNNFLLMKNERLVAPFQSTVTRFKSQEPTRAAEVANLAKQQGVINALHGLANVGQQALGSAYGSQNSFFSRSAQYELRN